MIDATCQVYKAEPDATTVNKVRKVAEENLDLEDGFFTSASWKQKSKVLIKEYVVSDAPPFYNSSREAASDWPMRRRNYSTAGSRPKRRKNQSRRTELSDSHPNQSPLRRSEGSEARKERTSPKTNHQNRVN